jgi:sec-independent protein translocase protein TatB
MFDWNEIVLIGVVALIVIGPKELPAVLRTIGQWTTKIRRMAGEFQSQFQEAMREAEMADLKKQVDEVSRAAKVVSSDCDPLEFKEAPKLELQPRPKPDVASATMPEPPAAAEPSETLEVAAAKPGESDASQSSSGQGGTAPEVGPVSETRPVVPLAGGSGQP